MLFWLVSSPKLAERKTFGSSGVNSNLTTPHLFVADGVSTTRHARLLGAGAAAGSDMPTEGSISVNQAFTVTDDGLGFAAKFIFTLSRFVLVLWEETELPSESGVPEAVNGNVAKLLVGFPRVGGVSEAVFMIG
jgi:hypothetical protein